MLALLSPTMRMRSCVPEAFKEGELALTQPLFLKESIEIAQALKEYDHDSLFQLLGVKGEDAVRYYLYWQDFPTDVQSYLKTLPMLSPAATALTGIAYNYLDAEHFSLEDWQSSQKRLRLLCAPYGLLCPTDAVFPYRLEMKQKPKMEGYKSLYEFWGNKLSQEIEKLSGGVVINLLSKEYEKACLPGLSPNCKVITCDFKIRFKSGEYKTQATWAKISRGSMARMIVKQQVDDPEQLQSFMHAGFSFDPHRSTSTTWIFTADEPKLEEDSYK